LLTEKTTRVNSPSIAESGHLARGLKDSNHTSIQQRRIFSLEAAGQISALDNTLPLSSSRNTLRKGQTYGVQNSDMAALL